MGGEQAIVVFWYGWGIHVTVGLSFLVQVMLLLLADIRRRKDWPVLNAIIWAGYTGADMVAVYALGHMSVLCRQPEHHLMALWAPLLLVHLGGQDSITAYAIEDNRLWLRHLLTFAVQVIGAVVRCVCVLRPVPTVIAPLRHHPHILGRISQVWGESMVAKERRQICQQQPFRHQLRGFSC